MSKLLISEPPLQVLPSLAEKVGLNEAIILQQIHYWTQNSRNVEADSDGTERTWVFKSHDEWAEEFPFWSRSTIRRAVKSLQEQGLIIAEQKRQHEGDNRNWYAIRREALPGCGQNEQGGSGQDEQKGCSKRTEGVFKMNRSARARKARARDKNTSETTTESDAPARNEETAYEAYRDFFAHSPNDYARKKMNSEVDDLNTWRDVLDYWKSNSYRASSTGKMISRYHEQVEEQKQSDPTRSDDTISEEATIGRHWR
jgi:hypothetical protein